MIPNLDAGVKKRALHVDLHGCNVLAAQHTQEEVTIRTQDHRLVVMTPRGTGQGVVDVADAPSTAMSKLLLQQKVCERVCVSVCHCVSACQRVSVCAGVTHAGSQDVLFCLCSR